MARSNADIAAELERIATSMSGPRSGALRRIAAELTGSGAEIPPTQNELRAAKKAEEAAQRAAEAEALAAQQAAEQAAQQ